MNTINRILLLASLAAGLSARAADPTTNPPAGTNPPALAGTNPAGAPALALATNQLLTNLVGPSLPSTNLGSTNLTLSTTNLAGTNELSTNVVSEGIGTNSFVVSTNGLGTNELRLNFHNVPVEMVLNYLSDAAGFIIVLETDVRGRVDVWSNQPLTKDEAVSLLNAVLNKNGYAAIRNDRTLTIVSRDAAKTRDIPVKREANPESIPKNEEMVTQIIPIRYINAAQLTKDLQPLMPLTANMTANEAGNALVITDTQTSIHRMAEIVRALDTSISNASSIRVYPLKYADAKTVSTVIKDLFSGQDSGSGGGRGGNATDMRAQFFQRMRGGGGGGGGFGGMFGGGGGGGADQGTGGGRNQPPKVVATSDDRMNALVVSMPDELVETIDNLVKEIDQNVEDITEVRVFHLKNADPVEMADLLANLFPDDTRSNDPNAARGGQVRFGGGGMFGGGFGGARGGGAGGSGISGAVSERAKKLGRVIAVPDQRTASVVVSAARDLMTQIEQMVESLDQNSARKQKVFVFQLENADPQEVLQTLQSMFYSQSSMQNRNNNNNQTSALTTRANNNAQTSSSLNSTSFSGSGSSGSRAGGRGN